MFARTNRIQELRKLAGLSQETLGEAVGCNKSKISKLENGNQELTQSWMLKIARALQARGLDITPSDLLPYDQAFRDEIEREYIETYRALGDSQKAEFHAMMDIIKSKSSKR